MFDTLNFTHLKNFKVIYIVLLAINIVFAVVAIAEQTNKNNISSKAEIIRTGPIDLEDPNQDDILGVRKRVSKSISPTTMPTTLNPTTKIAIPSTNGCTDKAKIANLSNSVNLSIKKLSEHQDVCNSLVTDRLMLFTIMPDTSANAQSLADEVSDELNEYAKYGLTPIVIAEPSTPNGIIDPGKYKNGDYDTFIDVYFARLKNKGITDKQLGIWVPFPEVNLPEWNNRAYSPDEYVGSINRYVKTLKKYFPSAKVSMLLDSQTYSPNDSNWANGKFQSLATFATGLQPGLIDMVGLQGFPWKHTANTSGSDSLDPQEFLNSTFATDAASKLGIKEVWFNTGTFAAQYTKNKSQTVYLDANQRKVILDKITLQAQAAQKSGFKVWINMFAENKSNVGEAINWSYWTKTTDTNADKDVYVNFVKSLTKLNIGFALFDSK